MTKRGKECLPTWGLHFTTALAGVGVALLATAGTTTRPASAQTLDWTGAVSEDWFDSGNWTGGFPNLADDVVIDTVTPNPAAMVSAGLAEASSLVIGDSGSGILTLSGGGQLDVGGGAGMVTIASQAGSSGTLYFGAGSADPADAAAPSLLLADSISFGAGTGTLVFNHDSAGFALTADISGSGTVRFVSGTSGLSGTNTYSGATVISGGTLVAGTDSALSANSDYTVGGGAKLELSSNVFAEIGSLSGAGTVELGTGSSLFIVGTGSDTVFSGSIAGDGDFQYDAHSALVLTGDSHIGGTLGICSCGTGLLEVRGGAFTADLGTLVSGGTLAVTRGGRLESSDILAIQDGSLRIDGPGSRATVSGDTAILGFFETGVLEIANGGVLDSQGIAELDSWGAGGPGVASVTGTGSRWNADTLLISASFGGEATLTLAEGGAASATTEAYIGPAGVLRLGTGGLAGTLETPALESDGRIVADFTDNATLAADISGGGSLTKRGPGTLILTGSNSYTGATTIRGGTLQVDTDSLPGDVANDGWLAFDQGFDATYTGQVSGSGGFAKAGAAVLTLAGANSYAGATWVRAGTLRLGSAAAVPDGSAVTVEPGATLDLAGIDKTIGSLGGGGAVTLGAGDLTTGGDGSSTSFSGTISGGGGLTKAGGGVMTLAGANSFTGPTTIEAGMLVVNGSLAGPLTIGPGGSLGGTGRLEGGVTAAGIVAPGNSIGTLTVQGDLAFTAGSTYRVEVEPAGTTSDLILVSGTASLGGARVLHVGEDGDYRPFATYTILTAEGGLSGTFEGVSSSFAFLEPTLRYDANSVQLTLTRNDVSFASLAATGNQAATAAGVQSLGQGDALYDAVVLLPDQAAAQGAFDALSGELYPSLAGTLLEDSRFPREAATARLRQAFAAARTPAQLALAGTDDLTAAAPKSRGISTWAQAFGSWGSRDGDGNAAGLDRSLGGVLLGADAALAERWRVGLFTGYDRRDLQVDDRRSSATLDSFHLGAYGGTEFGALGLGLGAAYAWHSVESERSVAFPGFSERLEADHGAATAQLFGEATYDIQAGAAALQPFAGLAWVHASTDGFAEEGGAAALEVEEDDSDLVYSTLGARAATSLRLDGLPPLTARASLGWRHAFGDTATAASLAFAGGDGFSVQGTPLERDSAVVQAGLAASLAEGASLAVSYDGQLGSRVQDHGVSLDLSFRF